jgi:hypothetical protein
MRRELGVLDKPVGAADGISVAHSASCGYIAIGSLEAPEERHNDRDNYVARIRGLGLIFDPSSHNWRCGYASIEFIEAPEERHK